MLLFSNICFYGGGAWGQALAIALASLGYKSTLIVSDKTRSDEINSHISKKFPDIKLSHLIKASVNANEIINESDLVFVTTESKRVMEVVKQIFLLKNNKINLVITSKGFATKEGNTFNEIIKDQFPTLKTGILTGPTFADEIANNLPAAAVLASNDVVFANSICSLFQNSCLRLYQSNDPIGASLAGAVKNIIAIGAGMIEGLNLGDISELSRLIKISGGNFNTAFGLAGIGDMSLTCSGPHSRNMAYGMNLVKGNNLDNTLELVEGVNAIGAAITLAKRLKIELPIVNAINQILNKNGNIREIIPQLLSRPIKDEF
jgi:glycerol-3-phosphate dehydrogenase (NAD(P)+)